VTRPDDLLTRLGELADSHDIRFGLYEPFIREAISEIERLREIALAAFESECCHEHDLSGHSCGREELGPVLLKHWDYLAALPPIRTTP
jgi:hypothetical protein